MKIPVWLVSLTVCALLSLQAWTLNEIVSLKVSVATLTARIQTTTLATHTP